DGIRDFHVTGVQTCALPISIKVSEITRPILYTLFLPVRLVSIETIYSGQPFTISYRPVIFIKTLRIFKGLLRDIKDKHIFIRSRSEERRVGKEWRSRCEARQ